MKRAARIGAGSTMTMIGSYAPLVTAPCSLDIGPEPGKPAARADPPRTHPLGGLDAGGQAMFAGVHLAGSQSVGTRPDPGSIVRRQVGLLAVPRREVEQRMRGQPGRPPRI
jgi:hypothetical protein